MATSKITPEEQARVVAMVQERGLREACKELQLDKETVLRLMTPLPVRKQTVLWVRTHLAGRKEMRL